MDKIEEWEEDVEIDWWKESRTKLNKVIRKYNKWVENHMENPAKTHKLLSKIYSNLTKSYCNRDGGSGYKDCLIEMKNNIERNAI